MDVERVKQMPSQYCVRASVHVHSGRDSSYIPWIERVQSVSQSVKMKRQVKENTRGGGNGKGDTSSHTRHLPPSHT